MQLTTEQKRIRIAEAVGRDMDYFNDLHAMDEAQKILWEKSLWSEYRHKLRKKYGDEDISATASERAEIFGRTLNLW